MTANANTIAKSSAWTVRPKPTLERTSSIKCETLKHKTPARMWADLVLMVYINTFDAILIPCEASALGFKARADSLITLGGGVLQNLLFTWLKSLIHSGGKYKSGVIITTFAFASYQCNQSLNMSPLVACKTCASCDVTCKIPIESNV